MFDFIKKILRKAFGFTQTIFRIIFGKRSKKTKVLAYEIINGMLTVNRKNMELDSVVVPSFYVQKKDFYPSYFMNDGKRNFYDVTDNIEKVDFSAFDSLRKIYDAFTKTKVFEHYWKAVRKLTTNVTIWEVLAAIGIPLLVIVFFEYNAGG